jgi:hypothetical protein
MATLTLKKPPVAERVNDPRVDVLGSFAVMRHSRNLTSLRFTAVYKQYADAKREAQRLAKELPTERFVVVFITDDVSIGGV